MDDMDHTQELILARQEATIALAREAALRERNVVPPLARECIECGCDIPTARLKARPTAVMCVECLAESEVRARRGR